MGSGVQRHGRGSVHADVTGPRRRVRRGRARRRVHGAPAPLRLRADGRSRHRGLLGSRSRRARHRVLVPGRARDTQLLRPLPADPGGIDPRHGARRRWRLRPEDVRLSRGVRDRARVEAARPAGQVDRGPAREPGRRRTLPQRAGHGAPGHRRRSRDPGHHDRARRRCRRLPSVPGDHRPPAAARSVQDPAPRLLDVDGVDEHDGQDRLPGAVDVRDDRQGDGDRPRRPHAGHRPRRAAAGEPAVVRRSAVHVAGREAVRRDHAVGDDGAGAGAPGLRRLQEGAGSGAGRGSTARSGHQRLRRADVDECADTGDRGGDGARRGERHRRRAHRHDVARPERGDDDGPDRRRHAWRRLRRRHRRPSRHAVDAVRPGHGRQPHRRGRRRRGPGGHARGPGEGPGRGRPHAGGGVRGPRDRGWRGVRHRHAGEVDHDEGGRRRGVPLRRSAAG